MPPRSTTLLAVTLPLLALSLMPSPVLAQGTNAPPAKPKDKGQVAGKVYVAPPPGLALFQKALAAADKGQYAEAERLYKQVVKEAPEAAAAWANLGLLVGRQGRLTEAIGYLEKATQLSPDTAAFWAQLSSSQLGASQWKPAEVSARKALALQPTSLLAAANLGDALFQQRRYKEAIPVLQRLRQEEGNPPRDHTEISLILAMSGAGKHSDALALAQKRATRLSKDVHSALLLGDTARRAGNMAVAEKAYRHAAALDPKNPGALAGLSATAAMLGDRAAALKLIDQRIARDPNNAILYFQKGYLIYTNTREAPEKRFTDAEQAFRHAAALDPKNALYQTYSGVTLMMQGPFPHLPKDQEPPQNAKGFDLAEAYLRGALSLSPQNTMARLALANIAEQRKQFDEALANYQAIVSYAPNDADAIRGIAGIYYATGKKEQAYAEMDKIARLLPHDTQALSELASWYVADQRLPDAQKTYHRILERDPANAPAHIALGQMLEQDKKPVEAVAEYQAAFAAQPKNRDAALLLGNALVQQKRTEDAINVYHQFLNAVPDNNEIRWQLAILLKDNNRYDEALAEMQALTLRADDPNRTLYLLSVPRLHLLRGRYDEAIRTLLQQLREHPKEDEIRYTLADAYEKSGQKDKAEETLLEIVNRPPDPSQTDKMPSARARILLGEMYERSTKWEEAAAQYEEVLRFDPMQNTALLSLSRVREKQQKPQLTTDFLENLVMSDPKEPSLPAVGGLHKLLQTGRKLDQWREFTKRLLAKYPDNRNAQYIRARSLTEENNDPAAHTEAAALYERITKQNPKDIEAQRNLGKELEALGRKDEATYAYKAVLKIQAADSDALAALQRLGGK